MKIYVNNEWRDGFVDYYKSPKEYRIKVLAMKNLERIEEAYVVRPFNLKFVWNYLREVGLIAVLRKIKSRHQERFRNEKYISCGIGVILEQATSASSLLRRDFGGQAGQAEGGRFPIGARVAFLAPLHPACAERIALPEELIFEGQREFASAEKEIYYLPFVASESFGMVYPEQGRGAQDKKDFSWDDIKGWSIYSGKEITVKMRQEIDSRVRQVLQKIDWTKSQKLMVEAGSRVAEFVDADPHSSGSKKKAVLFGYGHYAKTNILPHIKNQIDLLRVHEVDPTQMTYEKQFGWFSLFTNTDDVFHKSSVGWDSSPLPRQGEKLDVYFIAGFHHTHAPLAIHAMKQGAYAVVEKPIVTTWEQSKELLSVIREKKGKLFSGFHRRFSVFNDWAWKDLGIRQVGAEPVSYHCVVYEVPQRPLFWYYWPNSRSEMITNGCHWVDHFLFLNGYRKPKTWNAFVANDGTIDVSAELENGAFFTMTLTTKGAPYIGFRDYVELTNKNASVHMTNYADYLAENESGVIRKAHINKIDHYSNMYRMISEKISRGEAGDSFESIQVSSELVLSFEDEIERQRKAKGIGNY